ncbi:acyl-CoA dehydrogenase family protein [Martelella soudanensis]|uniref:acyl-CoA dehydrogenase family protein n=1 Tax=unclassified Martelella TaxID=2629616 RepID=UPI0015DF4055|nr:MULTISPECIES: acyl-CoA dehydrogenase family protein [unclassified Martelella]
MEALTDEERMLRDSVQGILSEVADPADLWPQLAELGMLGLALPESAGGAELGPQALMVFARAFGRAGIATPFLASEALAMPLLGRLADKPKVKALLADLASGARIATLALHDLVPVVARRVSDTFILGGVKMVVPAGAAADVVIVSAMLDERPALFLLDLQAVAVTKTPYMPAGPAAGADISLEGVTLPQTALLAVGGEAAQLIADATALGQLITSAEMLGGMERLLELTVDYLRDRRQFGQPLSSFQSLQHAAVDMYIELETARAMLDFGSLMVGAAVEERALALDSVKLKMNGAAKLVGESAVQLHGGIGMTEESLTGRIFSRLTALRICSGDSRSCMERLLASNISVALN